MTSATTKRPVRSLARARALRRDQTDVEYLLWLELKDRRLGGFKFTRQHPLGRYIVDFLCREKWLAVELDGSQHAESARDAARTEWLNAQGYSVLRFWNDEALRERESVLDTILALLEKRAGGGGLRFAPARPSPAPLPRGHLSPEGRGSDSGSAERLTSTITTAAAAQRASPRPSGERSPPQAGGEGQRHLHRYGGAGR